MNAFINNGKTEVVYEYRGIDMYDRLIENAQESISEIYTFFLEKAEELDKPEIYSLNRRSIKKYCAAVAVDAGESLFCGAFRMIGITLFSLATSNISDNPEYFIFYNGENLNNEKSKEWILKQLSQWYENFPLIRDFLDATGWSKIFSGLHEEIIPPRVFSNSSDCISFFRELIEWAKLYDIARKVNNSEKNRELAILVKDIDFVILRDGVLRFDNTGEGHSKVLLNLFKNLNTKIIGITKKSKLLTNPLIQIWLNKYKVLEKKESFIIKLDEKFFEKTSWALSRYYDGDMRFGRYHIVRFDSYPNNYNLFVVDIPDYLEKNWDEVLSIFSGLKEFTATTVYPVPGYPYPLIEAHRKAVLDDNKVRLIENFLKRKLSPEHYEMLRNLIDINMRGGKW